MPAGPSNQTVYIGSQGSISALNVAALYKAGELGCRVVTGAGTIFQLVQCDSGPASVAIGNVAFWKNKASYIVTNKLVDCSYGRNGVAGIFTVAVTPGNYCGIQIGGLGKVSCPLNNMGQGDQFIANSGTNSDAIVTANGTAPTQQVIGYAPNAQAAAAGVAPIYITVGDATPAT